MPKKIKFKKYYEEQETVYSESGSPMKQEYELRVDADGVEYLEKVGETNLHEYIQSFKDSVDVNKIIERVQLGDTDALNKVNAFYADVSAMQKNMQDILNMNLRAEKLFNELPYDIRQEFDNSFGVFLSHPERIKNLENRNKSKMSEPQAKPEPTPEPKPEDAKE